MKLVINIPCLNEEKTLPLVLKELPRDLPGVDEIEVQVVDDGSSDATAAVAEAAGCRVIRHKRNLGLGVAFRHGVQAALKEGADILVNTDADNQYPARFIKDLVAPVVVGRADVVIGDRGTWSIAHFSLVKRVFQWLGSYLVRVMTGTDVSDTVSGFRAYSRESLLRMNVTTRFSYVLDTIMQCAKKDLTIESVPIEVNPPTRKSRLFKNMFQHMWKSGFSLLRLYALYMPFRTFCFFSMIFLAPALFFMGRFLFFWFTREGYSGHVQSLIAAAILSLTAVLLFVLGILGELLKYNRELTEEQLYLLKKDLSRPAAFD